MTVGGEPIVKTLGLWHKSQHPRTPCMAVRHRRCRWLGVSDLRAHQRIDKIWGSPPGMIEVWKHIEHIVSCYGHCSNMKWWTIELRSIIFKYIQENLVSLIFLSTFHISCQVCNVAAQCRKHFVETMRGQSYQVLPGFPTTAGADLPCKWNNTTGTSSPYVHRKTWRPATQPCNITTGNGVKWIEMVSETGAQ